MGYIDKMLQWWPPTAIAAGLHVPTNTDPQPWNYIALAFWGCSGNLMDVALVWGNADVYFSSENPYGVTKD